MVLLYMYTLMAYCCNNFHDTATCLYIANCVGACQDYLIATLMVTFQLKPPL